MRLRLTIEVWKKGEWYLAQTPELDFISQCRTPDEAKRNLIEVIKIQFAEMREMNTIEEYLFECGFVTRLYNFLNVNSCKITKLVFIFANTSVLP